MIGKHTTIIPAIISEALGKRLIAAADAQSITASDVIADALHEYLPPLACWRCGDTGTCGLCRGGAPASDEHACSGCGGSGLCSCSAVGASDSDQAPGPTATARTPADDRLFPSEERRDEIRSVLTYYRTLHPSCPEHINSASREWTLIAARMSEGYTPQQLHQAIDGCHRSPFHTGNNSDGARHVGLTTIFRDAANVQKFIELLNSQASPPPVKSERSSAEQEIVRLKALRRRLEDDIPLARMTYPRDDKVIARMCDESSALGKEIRALRERIAR